jgi:hypothetical protein
MRTSSRALIITVKMKNFQAEHMTNLSSKGLISTDVHTKGVSNEDNEIICCSKKMPPIIEAQF